jgi:hypothetical protein
MKRQQEGNSFVGHPVDMKNTSNNYNLNESLISEVYINSLLAMMILFMNY